MKKIFFIIGLIISMTGFMLGANERVLVGRYGSLGVPFTDGRTPDPREGIFIIRGDNLTTLEKLPGSILDMAVHDNIVYYIISDVEGGDSVHGVQIIPPFKEVYSKNVQGSAMALTIGDDGTLYVAGSQSLPGKNVFGYWKDNSFIEIDRNGIDNQFHKITDIYLLGGDVYLGGYTSDGSEYSERYAFAYKNDKKLSITLDEDDMGTAAVVDITTAPDGEVRFLIKGYSGSYIEKMQGTDLKKDFFIKKFYFPEHADDVFHFTTSGPLLVGEGRNKDGMRGVIEWKVEGLTTIAQNFDMGENYHALTSAIHNGKVYVGGYCEDSTGYVNHSPCYWIDGKMQQLPKYYQDISYQIMYIVSP